MPYSVDSLPAVCIPVYIQGRESLTCLTVWSLFYAFWTYDILGYLSPSGSSQIWKVGVLVWLSYSSVHGHGERRLQQCGIGKIQGLVSLLLSKFVFEFAGDLQYLFV